MVSPSCKLYGLFISCISSLIVGIGSLVVNIVMKYIGFVDSEFVLNACTEAYLSEKYKYLSIQLQTAFVAILFNIFMNIIVLTLIIITLKNLKSLNPNPQSINPQLNRQPNLQTLPQSILSKPKIILIYILISFSALASLLPFAHYLTMYLQASKDPSTCSFTYTDFNLFILMVIAAVLLLAMLFQTVFALIVNKCVAQQDPVEQKQNKYKDLINVTEQPGVTNKPEDNLFLKAVEFTEEPSNGELHSFGNNQKPFMSKTYQSKLPQHENKQNKKPDPYILKDMDSSQMFKPGNDTPTNFGGLSNQYRNHNLNFGQPNSRNPLGNAQKDQLNRININQTLNPQRFYNRQNQAPQRKVISNLPIPPSNNFNSNTNSNQHSSAGSSPTKSPGKFYNSANNNPYEQDQNVRSIRNKPYQNQPEYNNPFSKPLTPIKQLNESVFDNPPSYTPSPMKDDPFRNVEMFTANQKANPQRGGISGKPKNDLRLETSQDDIGAQLMFHMKAVEEQKPPTRLPDPYKNDIQRFDKNSSGQVSFKSPSRFDSKFAQEQSKYLSKNTPNSILPALNRIKESEGSRRNNDNYSSGGINSYFAQSRGRDSMGSPGGKISKTKAREGVLTSFIRGKFA